MRNHPKAKIKIRATFALTIAALIALALPATGADEDLYLFNRFPLAEKTYTVLPLGDVQPRAWLRDELERMATGMTGHLDEWYPEVCGPRNAWLGGDGDTWERGPYWIDGLYPLAHLLNDDVLKAKAMQWVEWTLTNQHENGYIGPVGIKDGDRTRPAPRGAQVHKPDDWWPRMVMLKILRQRYMATGDERVVECLKKYFRYQLETLPEAPLYEPGNPRSGSWWAAQRGGDNLLVVLWFYDLTGEKWLLDLADLLAEQTVPVSEWFIDGDLVRHRLDQGATLHCVNFAQMMKTPIVRWRKEKDPSHLVAVEKGFADIRAFHGQPYGLYGGDELLHGHAPDRGSELCSAIEMMYSLENMLEISGDPIFADRLERVAYNALPTQISADHRTRQYFQQANQVLVSNGDRDFGNDGGDRNVYGLLRGYPCCTCNQHQGWPKFAHRLWFATADRGLAALVYAPSSVKAKVADGTEVQIIEDTGYPFKETIHFTIKTPKKVTFPLHLRIPGWCQAASLSVNGRAVEADLKPRTIHILKREWSDGDQVELTLPMALTSSSWYHRCRSIERGPLVYALDIKENWSEVFQPRPEGVPESAPHRGYRECRPASPWNYGLTRAMVDNPGEHLEVKVAEEIPPNPWTRETAPVVLTGKAVPLPYWTMNRNSAANPPYCPAPRPEKIETETIRLIPYGSTILRISVFPWIDG